MSQSYITVALRKRVEARANFQCEYCLLRANDMFIAHQVDHIIAEQHGGQTEFDNLALACIECNRHKGANIASLDPDSAQLTPLFNPRLDKTLYRLRFFVGAMPCACPPSWAETSPAPTKSGAIP